MDSSQIQEMLHTMIEVKTHELEVMEVVKTESSSITEQKEHLMKIERKKAEIETCDTILAKIQ